MVPHGGQAGGKGDQSTFLGVCEMLVLLRPIDAHRSPGVHSPASTGRLHILSIADHRIRRALANPSDAAKQGQGRGGRCSPTSRSRGDPRFLNTTIAVANTHCVSAALSALHQCLAWLIHSPSVCPHNEIQDCALPTGPSRPGGPSSRFPVVARGFAGIAHNSSVGSASWATQCGVQPLHILIPGVMWTAQCRQGPFGLSRRRGFGSLWFGRWTEVANLHTFSEQRAAPKKPRFMHTHTHNEGLGLIGQHSRACALDCRHTTKFGK